MERLSGERTVMFFAHLSVEDRMFEYTKERDEARATVLRSLTKNSSDYSSLESYGRSNDNFAPHTGTEAPLPYIEPTRQTDDGYEGLMPPLN